MRKIIIGTAVALFALTSLIALTAFAAVGGLLATVTLPGNGGCNVGITTDGNVVVVVQGSGCASSTLGVYDPPAGGGAASLLATKSVKDAAGAAVTVSVVDWDPARSTPGNMMLWAAYGQKVYLINIGNPTVSGDALATLKFTHTVSGGLIDGLARNPSDDTLYWSLDVACCVWQFSLGTDLNPGNPALGTLMNTVTVKNSSGVADGRVSGVAIGANLADGTGTLYVGRDGAS
ncbi:MAG: hypothetical protein Q8P59_06195, partial [Dehalococcoidia bacterium]|nr:hypothetical protein [Dehalococcoidia bacterium]